MVEASLFHARLGYFTVRKLDMGGGSRILSFLGFNGTIGNKF